MIALPIRRLVDPSVHKQSVSCLCFLGLLREMACVFQFWFSYDFGGVHFASVSTEHDYSVGSGKSPGAESSPNPHPILT